jgi:hypothetical protein
MLFSVETNIARKGIWGGLIIYNDCGLSFHVTGYKKLDQVQKF